MRHPSNPRPDDIDLSQWGPDESWDMLERLAQHLREECGAGVIALRRDPDDPSRHQAMNVMTLSNRMRDLEGEIGGGLAVFRMLFATTVMQQAELLGLDAGELGQQLDRRALDLYRRARVSEQLEIQRPTPEPEYDDDADGHNDPNGFGDGPIPFKP